MSWPDELDPWNLPSGDGPQGEPATHCAVCHELLSAERRAQGWGQPLCETCLARVLDLPDGDDTEPQ